MTLIDKVEELRKQVETIEIFLRSNPFLTESTAMGDPQKIALDPDAHDSEKLFGIGFEHDLQSTIMFVAKDSNILGFWYKHSVLFAPTDTKAALKALIDCGYFTAHEAMEALEQVTKASNAGGLTEAHDLLLTEERVV